METLKDLKKFQFNSSVAINRIINGADGKLLVVCIIDEATNLLYEVAELNYRKRTDPIPIYLYYIDKVEGWKIRGHYKVNNDAHQTPHTITGPRIGSWIPVKPAIIIAPTREDIIKHLEL